jgi:hypothetical protein
MVPAGEARRAAAKGVYHIRSVQAINLEKAALGVESSSKINKY